jgi:hypothetical protein
VPSNTANVPGDASPSRAGRGTGQQRSERLRARRDEAGMAQVSGWVPKERRAYAREVLVALARGANALPPDPEQAAALDAARADAAAARMAEAEVRAALAKAEQRGQEALAELGAARAEVEAAERARAAAAAELQVAEAAAAQARAEAERFRQAPGLRGKLVRWLVR